MVERLCSVRSTQPGFVTLKGNQGTTYLQAAAFGLTIGALVVTYTILGVPLKGAIILIIKYLYYFGEFLVIIIVE